MLKLSIDVYLMPRVILLGGTSAIGEIVEQQLVGTYTVERRAGTTRIETATTIAAIDAPQATTAVLARAFPSSGADQSQAFADALAAGGTNESHLYSGSQWVILDRAFASYLVSDERALRWQRVFERRAPSRTTACSLYPVTYNL